MSRPKQTRGKTVSARVTDETNDIVDELAEQQEDSKSNVVRRLLLDGLETREREQQEMGETDDTDDDRAGGRSVSALTILGVVSIALAPTMLASGQIAAGALLSMVAGVYALLWVTATDVVVEEALAGARAEVRRAGGLIALFRSVLSSYRAAAPAAVAFVRDVITEDHVVEEPETFVERLTYADVLALVFGAAGLVLMAPLYLGFQLGYDQLIVDALGVTGLLAVLVVFTLLAYVYVFLFGISAIASLAVMTAEDDATEAGAGAGAADTE